MSETSNQEKMLLDAIQALRNEIATLTERVSALEAGSQSGSVAESATCDLSGTTTAPAEPAPVVATAPAPQSGDAAAPTPGPPAEEISEELLLVISAAIAAFLGKRPHIRQIRLLHTGAWAQQGRVSIQASHTFLVRHEQ